MTKPRRRVGRFEIVRLLGEGAQSAVYLAYDPHLEREVAIKTLHFAAGADPAQNQLLLAEARTVSRLRHAHIVPIFEAGEEEGDPYLVFEYVEGRTLADLIRAEGTLPPHRAVQLMASVLDAIGHAHRHGVIHRDLKPSNVLIDAEGAAKVMDFGIATRISGPAQDGGALSGTPAYMAPEYVLAQATGPKLDIYAAGLVLFEMLFGRRAVQADSAAEALRQVATRAVELPAEPALPEPLRHALVKAVARDPDLRFESAEALREALEAYLRPLAAPADTGSGQGSNATLEFLLRHMRHKSDFPALSTAIGAINRLAASEKESLSSLSNAILKDFALTNKILRVVNSPHYRSVAGGSISTVSRAIVVLGFNTIRSIAVSLILFEHLENKSHAAHLKEEFVRVNLCALLARDLAGQLGAKDTEEAFLCALFHNLGRLLAQYYFPEEAQAVKDLAAAERTGEDAAAARVLGISYQDLGVGIARHWGFPEPLVHSMRRLPGGKLPAQPAREDRLRALAGLASEISDAVERHSPELRARELSRLAARFGEPLGATERQLEAALGRVRQEVVNFAKVVRIDLKQTRVGRQLLLADAAAPEPQTAAEATLIEAAAGAMAGEGEGGTAGESGLALPQAADAVDAQAVLTAGIQDISNSLADGGCRLDDLLRIVLETMYRAMGFQRVLLCLRNGRTHTMNARIGFGAEADEVVKRFGFRIGTPGDVFNLALAKGADLLIGDISQGRIADTIPEWYRQAVGAPTFIVFPLHLKGVPVALIYADKARAGEIAPSERELSLLRTLRNQAVLALRQST
jgi:serine/threonine protein kinase